MVDPNGLAYNTFQGVTANHNDYYDDGSQGNFERIGRLSRKGFEDIHKTYLALSGGSSPIYLSFEEFASQHQIIKQNKIFYDFLVRMNNNYDHVKLRSNGKYLDITYQGVEVFLYSDHYQVDVNLWKRSINLLTLSPFANNYSLQPNGGRPDDDGYLTYEESVYWYKHGNGQPLNVDLDKITIQGLYVSSFKGVGKNASVNLIMKSNGWDMMMNTKAWNDAKVYGNLTFKLYPNNEVKAFYDKYDFNMHSWYNPLNWPRNAATIYGERQAGPGMPYEIRIHGSIIIPLAPLPVK